MPHTLQLPSTATEILPPAPAPSPDTLARWIRERSDRMREYNADVVRLAMASGDDLILGRAQFTKHGTWLPWLRSECELGQRQALNYVALAQHRAAVEAYLQSTANLGRTPTITGALNFIFPPELRPPSKPKQSPAIETAEGLGRFLEEHQSLFWAALEVAPTLRQEHERRVRALATTLAEKFRPEPPPPPRSVQLDLKALPRALGLDDDGLDLPGFLDRRPPTSVN
jgi:hypothetical protein